jgi:hypothetical protein
MPVLRTPQAAARFPMNFRREQVWQGFGVIIAVIYDSAAFAATLL